MLQKTSPHNMAKENNECRDKTRAGLQKERGANDHGEERELIGHIFGMDDNPVGRECE
jgi:hypothetical protein